MFFFSKYPRWLYVHAKQGVCKTISVLAVLSDVAAHFCLVRRQFLCVPLHSLGITSLSSQLTLYSASEGRIRIDPLTKNGGRPTAEWNLRLWDMWSRTRHLCELDGIEMCWGPNSFSPDHLTAPLGKQRKGIYPLTRKSVQSHVSSASGYSVVLGG